MSDGWVEHTSPLIPRDVIARIKALAEGDVEKEREMAKEYVESPVVKKFGGLGSMTIKYRLKDSKTGEILSEGDTDGER